MDKAVPVLTNEITKKVSKEGAKGQNGARKSSIYAGFRALAMWFEYRLSTKLFFVFILSVEFKV